MEYLKHAEAQIAAGKSQDLTTKIIEWKEVGQIVTGELQAVDEFKGSRFETKCNRYTIDTDEGRVSCVLGAVVDGQLSGLNLIGHLLYIKFLGKKKTKTGNEMNDFELREIPV